MNTTLIFAELLIIGLQALTWATALIIGFYGNGWIKPLVSFFGNASMPSSILLIAFAYTLGILVDATSIVLARAIKPKNIVSKWEWVKKQYRETNKERMHVISQEGSASQFLAYVRSRLRILRGTCLNSFIFIIAWIVMVIMQNNILGYQPSLSATIAICGLAFLISSYSFILSGMIDVAHDIRMGQILAFEEGKYNSKEGQSGKGGSFSRPPHTT